MSPAAPGRGWRTIALVVAGCLFLLNLDSAIIGTSLPQIAASFHRRPVGLSVGISAYILAGAAVVPLSGWLADRLGARRVLLGALALFTLASIGCALADGFWPFILARIIQGAGGAVMVPVGQAVVLRSTGRDRMIQAIGLVTWPSLIAPVLGPALGGFITTFFSWRWNFWLNVPVGLLLATLILWLLPEYRAAQHRRLDLIGLALTSAAMLCLLAGLDTSSGGASRAILAVALIGLGVLLGVLAVRHLRRHPTPVLSLLPMRTRSFAFSIAGPGIPFRAIFSATPFLLPLLFQLGFHLEAVSAGMLLLVYFAGNLMMKILTTAIMQRVAFRTLLVGNGLLVALSVLACGYLDPRMPRLLLMTILFAAGSVRSLQFTVLTTLGFADIEPAQKNDAATLSSLIIMGTMAAGVAISAFLLTVVQARHAPTATNAADFRLVFDILAAVTAGAALSFLRLPREAGAHLRPTVTAAASSRG
jgi:EmrB/QacA subfamily drug resistance transporter